MKNIKDIMIEIEKLNSELATTANETPEDKAEVNESEKEDVELKKAEVNKPEANKVETNEIAQALFNYIPELKNIPAAAKEKVMGKLKGLPKEVVDELLELYKNIPEGVKQNLVAKANSMGSEEVKKQLSDLVTPQSAESFNGYGCPGYFDGTVNVCCTTQVPKAFRVDEYKLKDYCLKFIFDTSCLHCCIEPCELYICGTRIKVFKIKIVGHLPFAFSAPDALKGKCGNNFIIADRCDRADLCCNDSTCVDNTVCCTTDIDDAKWICKFFEILLKYCLICVDVDDAEICCKHQYGPQGDAKVEGYFPFKKCCDQDTFVNFEATLRFLTC